MNKDYESRAKSKAVPSMERITFEVRIPLGVSFLHFVQFISRIITFIYDSNNAVQTNDPQIDTEIRVKNNKEKWLKLVHDDVKANDIK